MSASKSNRFIRVLFVLSALISILAFWQLRQVDAKLQVGGGNGILALEFADTASEANSIVQGWQAGGVLGEARKSINWDWLFIIAYVTLLTTLYKIGEGSAVVTPRWFVFLPAVAGGLDILENLGMLHTLSRAGNAVEWVTALTAYFATVKFMLIVLMVPLILIKLLIRRLIPQTACPLNEVIEKERDLIASRKAQTGVPGDSGKLFGIALSGGGIRSATVNLGVLEVLNRLGLLKMADYLSTVSGGGYIGGYIHARLRHLDLNDRQYRQIFTEEDKDRLRQYGNYLTPGNRPSTLLRAMGAFVGSVLLNWTWALSFLLVILYAAGILAAIFLKFPFFLTFLIWATLVVLAIHLFLHGLRNVPIGSLRIWSSNALNIIEGGLLLIWIIYALNFPGARYSLSNLLSSFGWMDINAPGNTPRLLVDFVMVTLVLFITGFFSNPNVLSLHRFYRDRLSDAYLKTAGKDDATLKLHELNKDARGEPRKWNAPYPLINTCLNMLGTKDEAFQGTRSSDYFLLSPLYCGSKQTNYVPADSPGYQKMTLATAIAISGAAVNPNMGTATTSFGAFIMSLFGIKLGYWALNPKFQPRRKGIEWWPLYLIAELLSNTDTRKGRVNLSDGGHIENLAIYELLRRRCNLIIAIDAAADPDFQFGDLKNLIIRARSELGIEVSFRNPPEKRILPSPSSGFSGYHFSVADLSELPKRSGEKATPFGLLVYLKSSVKAPQTKWDKQAVRQKPWWRSFFYKTYHPKFPQESTVDQYFDEAQWDAYYYLGNFMAGDLLGVDIRDEQAVQQAGMDAKNIDELIARFKSLE